MSKAKEKLMKVLKEYKEAKDELLEENEATVDTQAPVTTSNSFLLIHSIIPVNMSISLVYL